MKQTFMKSFVEAKLLIARCLTLLILALLSTNLAWGAEVTKTCTVNASTGTTSPVTIDDVIWTYNTSNPTGSPSVSIGTYSKTPGLKFGKDGSNYWKNVVLNTDYFKNYNVKSVKVKIINNGKKTGTLTATQGIIIGTANAEFGQTWTELTCATNEGSGGTLTISYSADQACCINEITVIYEETPSAVATPTFTPEKTEFLESTSVSLACATEGASIYYTLDGTEPTKSSTQYTEAINISETTTIKAIAYKGDDASSVATKTYTKIVPLTTMDAIFSTSATAGDYWITFNNWVVSGVKNSNAYITDNAGKGLIVYKSGHGFVAGDILSGTIKCALTTYNGSAEITNLTSTTEGLTVTKNGTVNPVDATIANLGGVNTGAYINLGALTYNGTEFTDGTNTIKPYDTFITLPTLTEGIKYNVKGVYIQFNNTKEIAPLATTDFEKVAATEYEITVTPCENGSVTVDAIDNKAQEGQVVKLTVDPAEGYKLNTLTVTDASSNPITVTDNEFTMPASNVTISATFVAKAVYSITWMVNGEQYGEKSEVTEGDALKLPETAPDDVGDMLFKGWTATEIVNVDGTGIEYATNETVPTENTTYYAVYATKKISTEQAYILMESELSDYSGDYLIIYNNTYAMNTHSENQNANTYATYADISSYYTSETKSIESNTTTDGLVYRIAQTEKGYSLYCVSDESYLGITTGTTDTGSRLRWNTSYSESACDWTLGVGSISNVGSPTLYIKWNNTSGSYRFAAYASDKQQGIQLFRKQNIVYYSNHCTRFADVEITDAKYATLGLPYAATIPTGVSAYTATVSGSTVTMTKISGGVIPANCGVILYAAAGDYTFTETNDVNLDVTNKLVAALEGYTCTEADEGKVYYLGTDNNGKATFKKLTKDGTIAAGKAYLKLDEALDEGAKLDVVFGDEPTGIKSLTPALSEGKGVYNLNGMRVNGSYKGIVIVNGKKFINR